MDRDTKYATVGDIVGEPAATVGVSVGISVGEPGATVGSNVGSG